jgi:hypothetical protein
MKNTYRLFLVSAIALIGAVLAVGRQQSQAPSASAKPTAAQETGWQTLFDGKNLGKWKPSDFPANDKIEVKDGAILIGIGRPMSGITWSGEPPARMDYEIELEAMRTEGHDFFCGLTFPVGKDPCTLICGGWGGSLVGLSSIDGNDASENSTSTSMGFDAKRWYKIKVRVTRKLIEAWIDNEKLVSLETEGRTIGIRWEVEPAVPLGISTWNTGSALRNIRWRRIE